MSADGNSNDKTPSSGRRNWADLGPRFASAGVPQIGQSMASTKTSAMSTMPTGVNGFSVTIVSHSR